MLYNNLIMQADAYTLCSRDIVSAEAKENSLYNFTNRISPKESWPELAKDSRMVFFGIRYFIEKYLTHEITNEEIDEVKLFLKDAEAFGNSLPFDEDMWRSLVGKPLPLKIECIPEGCTFYPNEPVIQVSNTEPGYGELAAHIEALLVGIVSHGTALATLNRHWLERLKDWFRDDVLEEDQLTETCRFLLHDFGMRACCGSESSEILGLANLLSFHGTDTFNAAYVAWKWGAKRPTGTSIPALAHRIVQGHETEDKAYETLAESSDFASYVADCYNFEEAVTRKLLRLAEKYKEKNFVIRPDSGDPVKTVIFILNEAKKRGLDNVRFIQGDSIDPRKLNNILSSLGLASRTKGIFGVGGWRIRSVSRDSLSSAYKLAATNQPVCKLSEIPEKMSIPGPTKIGRGSDKTVFFKYESTGGSVLWDTTYYHGHTNFVTFEEMQNRNILSFDNSFKTNPNFGLDCTHLSDKIQEFRQKVYNEYRV